MDFRLRTYKLNHGLLDRSFRLHVRSSNGDRRHDSPGGNQSHRTEAAEDQHANGKAAKVCQGHSEGFQCPDKTSDGDLSRRLGHGGSISRENETICICFEMKQSSFKASNNPGTPTVGAGISGLMVLEMCGRIIKANQV